MTTRARATITLLMAALTAVAALRLGYEAWRLLLDPGPNGAVDLWLQWLFVPRWFDGQPVYGLHPEATYPPATFALMWPFVGWLPWTAAIRGLWGLVTAASLTWLVVLGLREADLVEARERWIGALLLLAMAPTAVGIGNGQLTIPLLAALLGAIVVLRREPPGWARDVVVALALLVALLKPHVSAPFFWVALFALRGVRPVALTALVYIALTAFSLSYQDEGALVVLGDWLRRGEGAARFGGYVNLHAWLKAVGLTAWSLPASLVVLAVTGVWVYWRRRAELWLLLGAVAIVARLWTYHDVYDDLLMVFPLIALYRMVRSGEAATAGAFLVAGAAVVLAPATLFRAPGLLGIVWSLAAAAVWLLQLAYFIRTAGRDRAPTSVQRSG